MPPSPPASAPLAPGANTPAAALTAGLPGLDLAELPAALAEAVAAIRPIDAPAGTVLFRPEDACAGFPVVLNGTVRVERDLPSGRQLALYEVTPGEPCVLSTSCLMGDGRLQARGVCVTDVRLAVLPAPLFDALLAHAPFRTAVFKAFGDRLTDLVSLVEAIGFQRLDQRLAGALLGRGPTVAQSHQALAETLGVSRESVSRMLRHFEDAGWVSLGRQAIGIRDAAALRAVAAGLTCAVTVVTDARRRRPG